MTLGQLATLASPAMARTDRHISLRKPDSPAGFLESRRGHSHPSTRNWPCSYNQCRPVKKSQKIADVAEVRNQSRAASDDGTA
jgi:hypothetical protein